MRFDQSILNLALDPVVNFGKVTLSIGYTSTDTTPIILNTGDGAKLPDPSISGSFNLVWWNWSDYPDPADDPNVEVIRVIARSGDVLSIMRSQEGTIPSNKNILGRTYKMILSQTKKIIGDIQTDAQSKVDTHSVLNTGVHGIGTDIIDGISARNSAISVHSGLTANVHNFDASGNSPPQLHGLASHLGIIGDHQGNLTGVGTNTHAQIDGHIGANSSVHNFDTLGNAPPQIHGKTKHDATTVDGGAALSLATQIPLHGSSQHTGIIGTTSQVTESTNLYYTDARARTSINNTAPINYNSGTGTIGITQASSGSNGYLNSTDWNTFNGKQNALGYTPENAANKGVFGGYAPLVGNLIPTTNLGSGSPSSSTFLRGDQTWAAPAGGEFSAQTDVTSLRSFGTIYRNTSGKTMMVNAWARSSSPLDLTAQSDAATTPITYVAAQRIGIYSDANSWTTITFLVLNNNYYKINCTGIKGGWIEWT